MSPNRYSPPDRPSDLYTPELKSAYPSDRLPGLRAPLLVAFFVALVSLWAGIAIGRSWGQSTLTAQPTQPTLTDSAILQRAYANGSDMVCPWWKPDPADPDLHPDYCVRTWECDSEGRCEEVDPMPMDERVGVLFGE